MERCREWTVAEMPTRVQLNGVVAARGRLYAVGNRGVLLERTDEGWREVFDDGIDDRGRGLLDIAATDDGRRLWLCGVRGTLGCYDLETGEAERFSQPYQLESNFREIAVHGESGEERVHVADDDGRVARLAAEERVQIRGVAVPGPNDPLTALFDIGEMLFAADTTGRLYQSPDGQRWRSRRLVAGVVTALAVDDDGLFAATREGAVYTGIRSFSELPGSLETLPPGVTPHDAVGQGEMAAIAGSDGHLLLRESADRFDGVSVGTTAGLSAVALREDDMVVAVGADGTVVEGRLRH